MRYHHDKRSGGARAFRELYAANLKTSRAWCIKESFHGFWHYRYPGAALKYFKAWKKSALLSRLKPVRKVALMFDKQFDGLLNYYLRPITNASDPSRASELTFSSIVEKLQLMSNPVG